MLIPLALSLPECNFVITLQGLADCLALMRIPFESEAAKTVNRDIFETIYYGALWSSTELAEQHGPHEVSFLG